MFGNKSHKIKFFLAHFILMVYKYLFIYFSIVKNNNNKYLFWFSQNEVNIYIFNDNPMTLKRIKIKWNFNLDMFLKD